MKVRRKRSKKFPFKHTLDLNVSIDSTDGWNLDKTLATIIAPALRRFKKETIGYPVGMTYDEWMLKLDHMIQGFEYFAMYDDLENAFKDRERVIEEYDRARAGIAEFALHFDSLWW